MSFLNKLWDETLAGPMPETGLGKLRKHNSLPVKRSSPAPAMDSSNNMATITRSITILKSNSGLKNLSVETGSSSPDSLSSSSSSPPTPYTPGTPSGEFRKFTRKKPSAEALESAESTSPTIDWILISGLDR